MAMFRAGCVENCQRFARSASDGTYQHPITGRILVLRTEMFGVQLLPAGQLNLASSRPRSVLAVILASAAR